MESKVPHSNGLKIIWMTESNMLLTINSFKPKYQTIKCGVPQGSILGPLLFLIYINDLSIVSEACLQILFADDANIFITGRNIDVMCQQLNDDLGKIQEWLCSNKLSLNVLKTHYMIFTPRNKAAHDVSITICSENISRVYVTKFLGVQIDAIIGKSMWNISIKSWQSVLP